MGDAQSALNAAGQHAAGIKSLGTLFLYLLTAIFLLVIAFTLLALRRRHRGIEQEPLERTHHPSRATEAKLATAVGIATAATVITVLGLVIVSVSVGKVTNGPAKPTNALAIEITGNQWWWAVRYVNDDVTMMVTTANELHIPVGRPVMIRGTSNDVIHSFWVPSLQGKRDLFPHHMTTEWIEADRPGRFRGQCAEFCGLQHAHMAFWVVAEPESKFREWMAGQLQPAAAPANPVAQRGMEVFMESACILCHTIRGTDAAGQVGPDLTHFASRLSIAAGTLPNNKGNLGGWIADPQSIKPGTKMAMVPIKSEDMEPLLQYLGGLR